MDSEDEEWLSEYNKDRKKEGLIAVTEDDFETIIDRLEKESYSIECQSSSAQLEVANPEDLDLDNTNCCICNDGESEDSNQIVFCDGCNIPVHQGNI